MSDANKGTLRVVMLGISLMASLYAYLAYAADGASQILQNDINQIATTVKKQSQNANQLDPTQMKALLDVETNVVNQQLNAITADLYGVNMPKMAPSDAAITTHFGGYCFPGEESGTCPSDVLLQFADANFAILFSGTQYDSVRQTAVNAFLNNLYNVPNKPLVSSFQTNAPVSAATLTADPTLKDSYATALTDEAFLSIVRAPFSEMVAKRTQTSTGQSEMAFMEQQALQRAMSATWLTAVGNVPIDQVQRDMARMQAFQVWMEYQRYRQMERIEALLAAMNLYNFRANKVAQQQVQAGKPDQQQIQTTIPGANPNPGSSPGGTTGQ